LSVSSHVNSYKIPSIDIISKIKKNISLPVKDESGGIVTLDKQCFVRYFKNDIEKELIKAFKHKYNTIKIEKVVIKPVNSFPNDFIKYKFDSISIKDYDLRKNSGNFIVIYENDNSKKIRIFFKYKILAKISLFKAKHNIRRGKILSQNDYEKVVVKFDRIPLNFVKDLKSGVFISKNFITKDSVITNFMIKKMTLVRKKDILTSIINDGGLQIEFFSKALEDGNKGDVIKTIGKNGKIYRAKIISKGLVIIQ